MNINFRPMQEDNAIEISKWKYEELYSMYSMTESEDTVNEFLNGEYFSIHDENSELIGYFCLGDSSKVPIGKDCGAYDDESYMDIGIGMKPDLTGKGLGYSFFMSILVHLKIHHTDKNLRLTVAKFNTRAIKIYKRAGFTEVMNFSKSNPNGDIEFITMVLDF